MWLLLGDFRKAMSSAPHPGHTRLPCHPYHLALCLSLSGEHCWGVQQVVCHQLHCLPQCLPHLDTGAFLPAASQQPPCWETTIWILGWGGGDCAGGLVCLKLTTAGATASDLSWISAAAWGHGGVSCIGYVSADLNTWTTASAREECCRGAAESLLSVESLIKIHF